MMNLLILDDSFNTFLGHEGFLNCVFNEMKFSQNQNKCSFIHCICTLQRILFCTDTDNVQFIVYR